MKKNVMMRLATFLLVAVLISTSAISGTYAKYVTEGTGTDSARVAKWGVTVDAKGTTFAEVYAKDDATFAEANSVISTDKVVAPGTKGDMVSMALAGTPEVAVRVNYTGKFDISDNWVDGEGKYYCPLVITIKNSLDDAGTKFDGRAYANAGEFETSVNNAISAYSKDYVANTDLSKVGQDALDITWEWPFSTSTDNDVRDTALGNQAVLGNAATVTIAVTTTITQID